MFGVVATFEITARDGSARAGVITTPHGDVRTPAFVPLASTATVKSLHASEVAELGFEMVLGNTFHLFIQPGHEHIADMGGLHEFMGWRRALVTDSGGYQVFSMGHGSVADEIKRRRDPRESMVLATDVDGVAIGGSLGQDKEQMRQVIEWSVRELPEERPRHLLGIGDVDDVIHA